MAEIIASTYEVLERLGAGGGGTVFLANHLRLDKKVVLKADKRKITTQPELLRREVDVLKNLNHEYIPRVYDFFVENDTVYTVMDYVEGESLDKPLKREETIPQATVVKWAIQLLEALAYLHNPIHGEQARGFVHSDIKPANMMRRPNGDICLIDFNIALAIGEENVVGGSAGYASPEHYGLDFSFGGGTVTKHEETVLLGEETATLTIQEQTGAKTRKRKIVVPDVRSDVYSTGATLYHLLSGRRPDKDATQVVPLSGKDCSVQIAEIITKAMNPNPDLRYQTANEMLQAFLNLRRKDPRARRFKRNCVAAAACITAAFVAGAGMTFVGLKQMERTQNAYALAEYSANALQNGDVDGALDYALQALPTQRGLFDPPYTAQAQKALTDALGVYELRDGYQPHRTISLDSAPLKVVLSPEETSVAVITQGKLSVFDSLSGACMAQLEVQQSALSDVVFRTEHEVIFAGATGLCAYNLEKQVQLWTGEPATAVTLSADGSTAAAIYKNDSHAVIYDAETGKQRMKIDFEGNCQSVPENDGFADPEDDLFALSENGRWLAVSFENGGVFIYDLIEPDNDIVLYETSSYTQFEGGFCRDQFCIASNGADECVFAVFDMNTLAQLGAFSATVPFRTYVDESGIYVSNENVLVELDPVTGEQREMAYTEGDISAFRIGKRYTLVTTENQKYVFFDKMANLLDSFDSAQRCDFVALSDEVVLLASMDVPMVRVLRLEDHSDRLLLNYDISYPHDEARFSSAYDTVMLFRFDALRLYGLDGTVLADVSIPDAGKVYDQQYRRDEQGDYLEVIYNDGKRCWYSAKNGDVIKTVQGELPDRSMREEFVTDTVKIAAELHGTPRVFDLKSGKEIAQLESEDYLTYVTQTGYGLITEYVTAENERYGLLLDDRFETLAKFPGLCDVLEDDTLVFDDMRGNLRQSRIYSIQELIALATL